MTPGSLGHGAAPGSRAAGNSVTHRSGTGPWISWPSRIAGCCTGGATIQTPLEAERRLLGLVAALRGDLRVGQNATVACGLPRRRRKRLLARFWRLRLLDAGGLLQLLLVGLVRISFGLVLGTLTSLVLLAVLVLASPGRLRRP